MKTAIKVKPTKPTSNRNYKCECGCGQKFPESGMAVLKDAKGKKYRYQRQHFVKMLKDSLK